MIIEKTEEPLQELPTPLDAPPAYKDIHPTLFLNEDKKPLVGSSASAQPSPTSKQRRKGKVRSRRFDGRGLSETAKEVRAAVYGLVRDVVRQPTTSASLALLESCAESCNAQNLSFSSILQDPSIENHPPIYWAIIKRPSPEEYVLLNAILSYSAPLTPQTMSEIRLACLQVGDQALFHSLWKCPGFTVLSGRDEMLLGASVPPDSIEVRELPDDNGAFAAQFEIVQFEKRMKVSGEISLEFIARGRIWWLRFHVLSERRQVARRRPGAWAVSLAILEHSTPTWINSRLVIQGPEQRNLPPSLSNRPSDATLSPSVDNVSEPTEPRSKPDLFFQLKTGSSDNDQLHPLPTNRKRRSRHDVLTALFDDTPMGSSLQYSDSSYYSSDGTLHASLEGQLGKPEGKCIIC